MYLKNDLFASEQKKNSRRARDSQKAKHIVNLKAAAKPDQTRPYPYPYYFNVYWKHTLKSGD